MEQKNVTIWQPALVRAAIGGSFRRLDPRLLWHNPVMFVVEIVSVITTVIAISNLLSGGPFGFNIHISIWLWFTVLVRQFCRGARRGSRQGAG